MPRSRCWPVGSTRWSRCATSTTTISTGSDSPSAPRVAVSASPDVVEDIDALRSRSSARSSRTLRSRLVCGTTDPPRPPTTSSPAGPWHRYLAEHGYVCLHWPRRVRRCRRVRRVSRRSSPRSAHAQACPVSSDITAIDLVGPVLIKFGTDEQKSRYLEPIRLGDDVWTQLFSEPGAGSDLAGRAHKGGEDADRLADQRPEGVEFGRQLREIRSAAGPYGSRQAPRPVDVRGADGHARRCRCDR